MIDVLVFTVAVGAFILGRWWERDGQWPQRYHCPTCGITIRGYSNSRQAIDEHIARHPVEP